MYEVQINGKTLYYPSNEIYSIFDTNLSQEAGLAGEFSFTVPLINPEYNSLENGAIITVMKDDTEYWRGEVRNITYDFHKNAKVYALEDVSWLNDEFLTPAYIDDESYIQRFRTAIDEYNANRSYDRQFLAGYITNVDGSNTCKWQTEYEDSILASIRKCIAKDDGYIRIRRVTSGGTVKRYIDVLKIADYGKVCNQPIQFGYNLLEYAQEFDLGNITNVLTPYGEELEEEVYEGLNERLTGTTITNPTSISIYGRHAKAVVFDNVSNLPSLNALAESYLSRYSQPQLTLEVSAIDLAEIDNWQSIDIGDQVRVVAEPFSIDQWLYVTKFDIDLQNPDKNSITLSGNVRRPQTITNQTMDTAETVKNIPSKASILESAKKNALAMLLDETQNGYIVYEYHYTDGKADYIVAINICDAPTIDASLSRWRWSYNGLGFLSRQSTTDPWDMSDIPIALTNTGEIVAERIGAGVISGCEMYWGAANEQYHGHLYYKYLLHDYPQVVLEADGHMRIYAGGNADFVAGELANIGGKNVYIGGRNSCSVGTSTGTLDLNGSSLSINGATGVTKTVSWVDETQRKAFGLGVTNGIITSLVVNDY